MRRTLSLLLAALFIAAPGFAYQQPSGGGQTEGGDRAVSLRETIDAVAKEMVAASAGASLDEPGIGNAAAAVAVQESERPWWKLAAGVGLLAGGAGLIARGLDLKVDEPDRFGRRTDSDAYFAIGTGGSLIAFGAAMLVSYARD